MAATGSAAWTTNNPVFAAYVFYSSLLVVKVLFLGILTGFRRITRRVFASPEDRISKNDKVGANLDPEVERARRAHQNDIENIFPFFTAGLLYVATGPSPALAINLFRAVFFSRLLHTLVYAFRPVPQPSRAIAFAVAYGCTLYMAVSTALFFSK